MPGRVRVAVVDDHAMVLESMASVIAEEADLEVVGTASSVAAVRTLLQGTTTDVLVTDYRLSDGTGAEVAALALAVAPEVRVLMITGGDDRAAVEAAISNGCAGFVSKGRGIDELLRAIRSVAAGAAVFPIELLRSVTRGDLTRPGATLTPRELDVLRLLAAAATVEEMAARLVLSEHTVRNHVRNTLVKLGASSKLEAVVIAVRAGIVEIDAPRSAG